VALQTMADDARSAQEDLAKSVQAVAPAAPQSSGGKTKIKKTHAAEIETMKKEHEKTRDALLKAAKDLQDALATKSKELITANKDLASLTTNYDALDSRLDALSKTAKRQGRTLSNLRDLFGETLWGPQGSTPNYQSIVTALTDGLKTVMAEED
jgi:DNA repair exonuclease SbcCD ATPase subunit